MMWCKCCGSPWIEIDDDIPELRELRSELSRLKLLIKTINESTDDKHIKRLIVEYGGKQ